MAIPAAQPHGELEQVFEDIFFVTGTLRMKGPLPMAFSRNMTVVRQGQSLVLINTLRLDDAGLRALDKLGKVEHVIRLAGFHGMDDPFYKQRYGAKVWVVKGQRYATGFNNAKPDAKTYFEPDEELTEDGPLPLEGAKLFTFSSASPSEGLILLERDGGILVSGDSLQNWASADGYFNLPAKLMMKLMGFIKPHNLGPGWVKEAKPQRAEVQSVLELPFEHLLPAHGSPVRGDARELFRPAIERY